MLAAALAACAAPPNAGGDRAGESPKASAAASSRPAAAASLAGTRWMGVIDPSINQRYAPVLEFVTESRVSGYTGCNLLQGAWKIEGGETRVGPVATGKRACAGPEQEVERRLLAVLNEKSRIAREGGKLVFTAADGERFEFVEVR